MNPWGVILVAGLLTYGIRLSFIALFGKMAAPPAFVRALRFVPPAVLSAIIVPDLFFLQGSWVTPWLNARLIAGLAAVLVAIWRRNIFLTISVGMAVLLLLKQLGFIG